MMTHAALVSAARDWLWKTKRCSVVVTDMVSSALETPDAIGWLGWASILVECKASYEDFRADQRKPFRKFGGFGLQRFYLAVPGIIPVNELPEGWGLLELTGPKVRTTRDSKVWDTERHRDGEILLLLSALRRIGQTCPEGVSIKCYTIPTKCRATLGVAPLSTPASVPAEPESPQSNQEPKNEKEDRQTTKETT